MVLEVTERRAGTCEATGWPVSDGKIELHHRTARAMGGSTGRDLDVADNLLGLCRACHAWAHSHPRQARERGLIVPSWGDPADVVVISDPRLRRC